MDLNNTRNLVLAKKAVYAEQLFYYSKLCQTYQELAKGLSNSSGKSTMDIETRYADPLAKIVSSENLEETFKELSREYDPNEPILTKKYSNNELQLFQKFSRFSEIFKSFQQASLLLDSASSSLGDDREKAVAKFHKYLSSKKLDPTINRFNELISVHSPRYLGSRFFLIANRGLENINSVDETHIPLNLAVVKEKMSPRKFGAIITGYKTIEDRIEDLEQNQPSIDYYKHNNWSLSNNSSDKVFEAENEFESLEHSIHEKAFVVGSKANRFYTAHKETLKKAVAVSLAVAAIVGGGNQIKKEIDAHGLDVFNSTQYEQTVTDETKAYIRQIMEDLNMQSNAFDPQEQDVKSIEENIDLVLDYVVRDQVSAAFEDYHDGYKVTNVESRFDKTVQNNSSEPVPYRFIEVSYVDDKGKEGKEIISDFRSESWLQNPIEGIFNIEEEIDLNHPTDHAFLNTGDKNFIQRAEDIEDVMEFLSDSVKKTRHYAAFSVKHGHSILGDPYLKSTIPNEKDDNER